MRNFKEQLDLLDFLFNLEKKKKRLDEIASDELRMSKRSPIIEKKS